ncbi:MAG TPA: aminotransferase class IV [Planctomycetota bacterium]|nr:aminotransferase class IV [Planctomycetota bacterium]
MSPEALPHRIYALSPEGAQRLHPDPYPDPFYALYGCLVPGLYEAARTYPGGKVYGFERHLRRLLAGCEAAEVRPSLTEDQLRQALQQAIDDHPDELLKLRWDLCNEPYAGLGTTARMIATITPLAPLPEWVWEEGVQVRTTHELVRHRPSTKGSAFAVERHRIAYGDRDYFEPVLLSNSGKLLEGAQSNFGAFLGGRLHASTRDALPGITIGSLIELARANGLEVVEEPVSIEQLGSLDEAFLCSSVRGVVPIGRIDETAIGSGRPGPSVTKLWGWYQAYATQHAARLWPKP